MHDIQLLPGVFKNIKYWLLISKIQSNERCITIFWNSFSFCAFEGHMMPGRPKSCSWHVLLIYYARCKTKTFLTNLKRRCLKKGHKNCMLEGCQAISLSQPDLNHSNRNRLLRGTRGLLALFSRQKKCPNHFNCITRLSVSTCNKILQYMAGKPQYTWENGKL